MEHIIEFCVFRLFVYSDIFFFEKTIFLANIKNLFKMLTVVLAHCWFVATIERIGSHHACGCLTVLMVASMSYLNHYHCYCCHVERIHLHFHLDASRMVTVVDLWLYPVSLYKKKKQNERKLYENKAMNIYHKILI